MFYCQVSLLEGNNKKNRDFPMTYYKKTRELLGDVSERKMSFQSAKDGLVSTPEFELRRKFVTRGHLGRPGTKKTGRFMVTNVKFHGAVTTKKSMTSSKSPEDRFVM